MSGLTGKTALVTGASRGIGRSVAQRLAADGALVAVHYGTDMNGWLRDSPEAAQRVVGMIALGRHGQPADVGDAVAFFASDDARWITGQTLEVNGGLPRSGRGLAPASAIGRGGCR